ncbi:MAG: type II toxin-antitoxin system VapC family toxin [Planctomycetota bacterium]
MKPKVYIETTIVSYLASKPSGDLVTAAHQKITHDWWDGRSSAFDLYTSALVLGEAGAGDPAAARRRLELLEALPVLEPCPRAESLARALLERGPIPREEPEDALHIALATVHGMEFLLTWNCAHIANAELRLRLVETCGSEGFELPYICTPEELMGEHYRGERP